MGRRPTGQKENLLLEVATQHEMVLVPAAVRLGLASHDGKNDEDHANYAGLIPVLLCDPSTFMTPVN